MERGSRWPTRTPPRGPRRRWTGGEVLAGAEGLVELITEAECDLVLNALVGSAGLGPTIAALGEGIDLALANKESLVVGGELVTALAEATGAQLIPVDSEHSALHQLIASERAGHGRPARADRVAAGPSGAARRPSSSRSRASRRSRTRPGRWAGRSRSTRRR